MKKTIGFLVALMSVSAFADKPINLTKSLLEEIVKSGKVQEVNVYLSNKTIIERTTNFNGVTEIDSEVDKILRRNSVKEVIGKRVKGKIIAIDGEYKDTSKYERNKEDVLINKKVIYISFGSCNSIDCAMRFAYDQEIDYSYSYSRSTYIAKSRYDAFRLDKLSDQGIKFDNISIERKTGLFSRIDASHQDNYQNYMARFYKGPFLKVKLNELKTTIYKKIKYGGAR